MNREDISKVINLLYKANYHIKHLLIESKIKKTDIEEEQINYMIEHWND